jgi:integrase
MATNQWTKVGEGMRRNRSSNTIYANLRYKGKVFRHSLQTEDKTVARNRLGEFRRALESGKIENAENTTVEEVSPMYLGSIVHMSRSDQIRSKGYVKFFGEEFGARNPRLIKSMEIQEWLNGLRKQRKFGEDSYNKYVACLKDFYAFLIKNHFASENPVTGFDFLKAKAIRKYTPTTEEVAAIVAQIRAKAFFPEKEETADFIEFMALTGQGRAEVEHLVWQDVLWDAKRLAFYRQKTRAKAHTMPLFPAVRMLLEKRWKVSGKDAAARVFKIKNCKKAIQHACERLGFAKLGHHSFRRFFITARLMEGVPPNIVAKWVGHSNCDMVMEIYSSVPTSFEEGFADNIQPIGRNKSMLDDK